MATSGNDPAPGRLKAFDLGCLARKRPSENSTYAGRNVVTAYFFIARNLAPLQSVYRQVTDAGY
jgi:hypothetical protein